MLKIYNLKDKQEHITEVAELTQKQWGKSTNSKKEFEDKVNKKINKIRENFNNPYYCKLILVDDKTLIGFISIFENDSNKRPNLFPWYATMFVKEEFRGNGYSKILHTAILEEAKNKKIKKIYLKTQLQNYYEKLGAIYLEDLDEEKIYYFDL